MIEQDKKRSISRLVSMWMMLVAFGIAITGIATWAQFGIHMFMLVLGFELVVVGSIGILLTIQSVLQLQLQAKIDRTLWIAYNKSSRSSTLK